MRLLAETPQALSMNLPMAAFVEAEQRERHALALGLGDQRGVLGHLLDFEAR